MRGLLLLLLLTGSGCAELTWPYAGTVSVGTTGEGWLAHGLPLPDHGPGFVRGRPGEGTRYGTPRLLAALEHAAARVATDVPGGAPLVVGDLSRDLGGRHFRHASHESGRDADVLFYAMDAAGRSARASGFLAYDRFGLGMPRQGEAPEEPRFFDDARNWALVRALIEDDASEVEWIFCARGLKARLLRYAARTGASRELLFRASWLLQQPSHGAPHDDHFHVRVRCTDRDQSLGCRDRGPEWSWLRQQGAEDAGESLADDFLVSALLDDAPPVDDAGPHRASADVATPNTL
ncbi:MAG: penicillin-insensitive murein endopeptidase [Myxococcales bacterium]|nr:penicillin-insensitive murein endopeptidase [Myxococcales bacterium]